MGEIRAQIHPIKIDMICPTCGRGYMRPTDVVYPTSPPQYPHKCNKCGYSDVYRISYPYLVWEDDSNEQQT